MQKNETRPPNYAKHLDFKLYYKIILRWIKHLSVRPETVKLLEESIEGGSSFILLHVNIQFPNTIY